MGRKLYAEGQGFNPTTGIDDVEGLREELDALKENGGGGGGDNTAIERRLTIAEGEIDDLQRDVAAVGAKVSTLQGTDSGKSVRTIAAEETAKIVGNAPANYDTLKEIADYIASDATGAAELNNKVNKNTTDIATLQSGHASIVAIVESQGTTISTHTQQITNLVSNKLGKNDQAEDSKNLGGVAATEYMQKSGGTFTGNVAINGTMTATATYHSSDERLKTFEGDVEVDLEKLKALPKKYFHWTADADGKRQLGTSAQAVEEVFPELVSTDANDSKSVNYANLSIVALAAIDKLAEQNAELERRLAKIEKMLNIE